MSPDTSEAIYPKPNSLNPGNSSSVILLRMVLSSSLSLSLPYVGSNYLWSEPLETPVIICPHKVPWWNSKTWWCHFSPQKPSVAPPEFINWVHIFLPGHLCSVNKHACDIVVIFKRVIMRLLLAPGNLSPLLPLGKEIHWLNKWTFLHCFPFLAV